MVSILVLALSLVPPGDAAKKKRRHLPDVRFALASWQETTGELGIAVTVGNATDVSITYQGATKPAANPVAQPQWWEAGFTGPAQDCYRIVVRAHNSHGGVKTEIGAGRLGTDGCEHG
jgi:hypothetical protein